MASAASHQHSAYDPVPACAGIGFKPEHAAHAADGAPGVGWVEVHAENYMGAGGPPHRLLERVRSRLPLSVHGVGLSLGGAAPPDRHHLARLKAVIDRYRPGLVSEHLAWSSHGGAFLNDLLPLPYTEAALANVAANVLAVQDAIGRRILIENPSRYVRFATAAMDEIEFLAALAAQTGCGLLLDVNNVHVSAVNLDFEADAYIDRFPVECVGEIHLAGHAVLNDADGRTLCIDSHDRRVCDDVWSLYRRALARCGPVPTLIEWDNAVPGWETLVDEARRADRLLAEAARDAAA